MSLFAAEWGPRVGQGALRTLVILAPYFGAFVYLVVRLNKVGEHAAQPTNAEGRGDAPVRARGRRGGTAHELAKQADLTLEGSSATPNTHG